MSYFVMECKGVYPSAALQGGPKLPGAGWFGGRRVTIEIPTPLIYTLDPERRGKLKAMYAGDAHPLMRMDLIECLHAAGVNNLELFDTVIQDPETGEEHKNFKAFNIVGVVSAADMDKSKLMGTSDSTMIDIDFDSLAIDEEKAAPFKMFRLAECVSAIIVNEVVKQEIERQEIPGMDFYNPSDWSG